MAIESVKSVVIQKLSDMLSEKSITFDIVIADQLNEMIKALNETGEDYLIAFEEKQKTDNQVKTWVENYLLNLYNVEDAIDTFVLSIARNRKRFGFLMNRAFFFNNLNACRRLRKMMKTIRAKIKLLNHRGHVLLQDTSHKSYISTSSFQGQPSLHNQQTSSGVTHIYENGCSEEEEEEEEVVVVVEEEEEEEEEETGSPGIFKRQVSESALQRQTGSIISELYRATSDRVIPLRTVSIETRSREHLQQPKLFFSYSYDEKELGMVGFRKDLDTLVNQLTLRGDHIVSIVGTMGSGKTTLARAIYGHRQIKQFFDCRAWISVSEEYTKFDLLLSLLKQVNNQLKNLSALSEQVLENSLLERLREKKCLIVLDDVLTPHVWEKLNAFLDSRNGSTIMFTTCKAEIASHAVPDGRTHRLRPLSSNVSWEMFLSKAGKEETSPGVPDAMKRRILEICNGLPLSIVLLGGLLSTKEESRWSAVLSTPAKWLASDILSLSYRDLPVHSKLCLLYLALFPKEFDISVRRLLRLWLAEGFVERSTQSVPEDVVQKCFEDLVDRSLIQISKLRSDGYSKRCRLPGAVHDYLLLKSQEIGLFYAHRTLDYQESSAGPFGVRRIIEYADIKNFSNVNHKLSQLRRLRSYLSFNFQKKDTPAKEVGRFVSRIVGSGFGLLRVLDLEGVYKPNLPDKLGHLLHLRYLGLRWTFLDTLPPSVGDLPYLETLDIKHTYINSLPNSIWKLKLLRHLNLNGIRLDMPTQPRSLLTGLITLWGLFIDYRSLLKDGSNNLRDLRELSLTFDLSSNEKLIGWIASLTSLQFLRLRSKDGRGRPSKFDLNPFFRLEKLSNMNLMGNLLSLPEPREFPPTLKVLTLSVSLLNKDPMPTLGQLPRLTVLRLLANSFTGREMVCPQGSFAQLRVLKLWMLKELEDWDLNDGAMQCLKELNIRCCDKLNKIPPTLLQRANFEELILTTMPDEFIYDVRQKKSLHTSLTVNQWTFTALPWEHDDIRETRYTGH